MSSLANDVADITEVFDGQQWHEVFSGEFDGDSGTVAFKLTPEYKEGDTDEAYAEKMEFASWITFRYKAVKAWKEM